MADDPLFGFKPVQPAPADDPLMGFKPVASSSSAAAPDLGSTALWNKPASASWPDYLMAHMAKPFQGADQAAQDYLRTAVDAATFGLGDRFQSYLTGNPLDKERAETAAASSRLGAMAPIVSGAMYAIGPGELGIAKGLGEAAAPVAGKWLGGVLGSGVEGAGAGMIGAAGHDENPNKAMGLGALAGAAGGVPGGVVGRGGALAPALSEDALRARASQEYAPLDEGVFHGPSQVKPALDAVTNTMTDSEQDLAKSTMAKVNKLADKDLVSGADLQSYQKLFGGLAKTGSDEDKQFAPQFNKAIEGVMQSTPYGRNLTPGQGMSLMLPGPLGGTGLSPGSMAAARDAGDIFHGRANDVERLDDWITRAQVARGPDVGDQARSYMLSKGTYAKPGAPGYDELNTLAGTGAGQAVDAAPSAYDVRHGLHPLASALASGAAAGAGGQIAEGHFDPAHLAAETLAGAALGYGVHRGVPAFQAKFFQGPAQQRAIDAYRTAASTGQPQAPVLPFAPLRDTIRNLIYGRGASGGY